MGSAEEERIVSNDPLNERQEELIKQVKAGKVTEDEPDTETQLLTLARQGHLIMGTEGDPARYTFTVPKQDKPARKKKG